MVDELPVKVSWAISGASQDVSLVQAAAAMEGFHFDACNAVGYRDARQAVAAGIGTPSYAGFCGGDFAAINS